MSRMLKGTELAKELNVHPNTIGNWKKQGMPCDIINGRPYYDPEEVRAWIKGQTKEA